MQMLWTPLIAIVAMFGFAQAEDKISDQERLKLSTKQWLEGSLAFLTVPFPDAEYDVLDSPGSVDRRLSVLIAPSFDWWAHVELRYYQRPDINERDEIYQHATLTVSRRHHSPCGRGEGCQFPLWPERIAIPVLPGDALAFFEEVDFETLSQKSHVRMPDEDDPVFLDGTSLHVFFKGPDGSHWYDAELNKNGAEVYSEVRSLVQYTIDTLAEPMQEFSGARDHETFEARALLYSSMLSNMDEALINYPRFDGELMQTTREMP